MTVAIPLTIKHAWEFDNPFHQELIETAWLFGAFKERTTNIQKS
jgi:hypothetical protein